MKRYIITLDKVKTYFITAENEEEAVLKANEMFKKAVKKGDYNTFIEDEEEVQKEVISMIKKIGWFPWQAEEVVKDL